MNLQKQIADKIQSLPEDKQQEVLIFIEFLLQKNVQDDVKKEDEEWNYFSLNQAMTGLEKDDLPEYTMADLKEKW
jgi:hypothetical protein